MIGVFHIRPRPTPAPPKVATPISKDVPPSADDSSASLENVSKGYGLTRKIPRHTPGSTHSTVGTEDTGSSSRPHRKVLGPQISPALNEPMEEQDEDDGGSDGGGGSRKVRNRPLAWSINDWCVSISLSHNGRRRVLTTAHGFLLMVCCHGDD